MIKIHNNEQIWFTWYKLSLKNFKSIKLKNYKIAKEQQGTEGCIVKFVPKEGWKQWLKTHNML